MKLNEIVVIIVLFAIVIGFTIWYHGNRGNEVCFENNCFEVEVVADDASRTRGLMFREELDEKAGMLFVWEEEGVYSFWMKDTLIPLDMIWINAEKEVV
ncbi:MAG: DUF192 domain-containing protein, partial [Nanoarchaeota archaeon]